MSTSFKSRVDDLQQSHLIKEAYFDGILGIPKLNAFEGDLNVEALVPFSERKRFLNSEYAVSFFEKDPEFKEVLDVPEDYVKELKKFKFVVSPDCSMYRDAPLIAQLTNLNNSRKVSFYWQFSGVNLLPLIRWGSEETFTTEYFSKPPAFLGIEQNSPVCVSNYGCYKSRADKYYFREGFEAMLKWLHPNVVVLYGAYDNKLKTLASNHSCQVKHSKNWTTYVHQRGGRVG